MGLTVRPGMATTDSNHDRPIFPNLAKNIVPTTGTSSGSPTSPTSRSTPTVGIQFAEPIGLEPIGQNTKQQVAG